MIDLRDAFATAVLWIAFIAVLIGVILGGVVFEGLPWLYHHLSFSWK